MGQGILTLNHAALKRIAEAVGTPVFVYSAECIRRQHAALEAALQHIPHRIHYSVKANSSLGVLALIRQLGMGVDIVSGGELVRVLRAGFSPPQVVFSGVGKTAGELSAALEAGVGLINVESDAEFELLRQLNRGRHPVALGIRVNPDVTTDTHPYTQTGKSGMKFGVPLDQVLPLAASVKADSRFCLISIGMHIGSQITDAMPYRRGAETLAALVAELRQAGLDSLESVDVGGGLGISYGCGPELKPEDFARAISPLAEATGLRLLVEPGRFLVGNAGCLLTRCLYRKRSGGREVVITDAGMNDLLRPSLYQAYHEIQPIEEAREAAAEVVDIVGPNCESGDFLGLDRRVSGVTRGSLLVVNAVGAYGFGMSSNYNSRPRAAEVMLDGDRYAVIRARETVDDLMRGEVSSPEWNPL